MAYIAVTEVNMRDVVKPIRTKADYERALREVATLWGAKLGTRAGNHLDMLAKEIEAFEDKHYPIRPSRRQAA